MYQLINKFERKHMVWLVNSLVFLFFVTVLAFPKGYSIAPMALAIIGVIYLFVHLFIFKKKLNPTREDKWLIFAFVFYFSTFALSAIIHGDGFREIDNPSRVLLFLPLLLLFREFPLSIKILLYGIPVGAAVAGIIAIYQKFYLGLEKPFPYLMHIQAGDIAISLAMMSLAIAIYWGIRKNYKWMLFSLVATGFGILASGLTGARGGWVGLPIILTIILGYSYKNLSKKATLGITLLLSLVVTAILITPETKVMHRMEIAYKETVNYFEKNQKSSSLGARFDMWDGVFLGIQEKPILGWGSKGYIELKKKQIENKTMNKSTLRFNDAHNQYLDAFIKKGAIGFLSIIAIIFIPAILILKKHGSSRVDGKLIDLLGIVHIMSCTFFFTSQTFLAHNSGSLFYFFLLIVLYRTAQSKT